MDSDVKDIFELEKESGISRGAASLIKEAMGGVKVAITECDVLGNGGDTAGAKEDEEDRVYDEATVWDEQRSVRSSLLRQQDLVSRCA